jgi:hypothetical protein
MKMNRLCNLTKRAGGRSAHASASALSNWLRRSAVLVAVLGAVLIMVLLVSPVLAATFSDVYSNTYDNADYPDAVAALSELGVVGGFDDGTFRPHDPVTRQQFAKMIVKLLGYPVTGDEICPFVDVLRGTSPTDPFYPDKYVAVCAANGVTQGVDATHFAPYNNITRAQVISMVVRAAQRSGVPLELPNAAYYAGTLTNSVFRNLTDANHGLNVQIAEMNNLFWGVWPDEGNSWNIYGKASRGEVAQILWRLLQKMAPPSTTTTVKPTTTTTVPATTTTTVPSSSWTLVADDDFSNTSSGWGNNPTWSNGYYYRYENGAYVVEIQPSDTSWLFSTYASIDITKSWVEADLTLGYGDLDCGCGLVLRYQDSNNLYLFEFDVDGNYAMYKRVLGTWTKLAGWTYSAAINTMGTSNHVEFVAVGSTLTAVVNGFTVCTVTDSSLSHGSAGFYAEALGSSPVKAIIDNLAVWKQ